MADAVEDFEDLFDNAPCGYVAAGPDGRIDKVNRTFSKWLSRDKAEFVGHNGVLDPGVNLLQKPASLEQLAATVREVLDGDR